MNLTSQVRRKTAAIEANLVHLTSFSRVCMSKVYMTPVTLRVFVLARSLGSTKGIQTVIQH